MTRNPHDQFAKQFLEELLSPFGQVETSREVLGEPRLIDLWFQPNSQNQADLPDLNLGLLGTMTQAPCLLEPYRNVPNFRDIRSCLTKRLAVVADQERNTPNLPEADLPHLWILVPTFSDAARHHCGASPDPNLLPGCYGLPPLLGTHLIILHQLPPIPETLWLRLLGKGRCQRHAIREVLALPQTSPCRDLALQLLANWKIAIDTLKPTPSEEEETLMALSQAYREWEQKTIRLGEERGIRLGEERGIRLGEERGIRLGEERGLRLGADQERRRLVLELLELELGVKFGEAGRSLVPYLQAIANTELLYGFLRSIKPLDHWEAVQTWWFDRLEQELGSLDRSTADPLPELAVAVKLRFPTATDGEVSQAHNTLRAQWVQHQQPWSVLRQGLEEAPTIASLP